MMEEIMDKIKKFKWTFEKIWTILAVFFMAYMIICRYDLPAVETVSKVGGFMFLVYFLLKLGDWI